MKAIKEILRFVTKKRLEKIEVLDKMVLNERGGMLSAFYDAATSEGVSTDEDAAMILYNERDLSGKYRRLKSSFKRRLYNNLFFLDVNDAAFSDYHRASHTCHKNMALIKIMVENGARYSAVELAMKTLKVGRVFQLTQVVLFCAAILKDHAVLTGNLNEHVDYWDLIREQQQIQLHEGLAEHYYQDLILRYSTKQAPWADIGRLARGYVEELEDLGVGLEHFNFSYYLFKIRALVFLFEGDHEGALGVYDAFEVFLNGFADFKQPILIARNSLDRLSCYLHTGNFEDGKGAAKVCVRHYRRFSNNWFVFMELYFLLAMRTGEYGQANDIFSEVRRSVQYDYLIAERKEKWRIFEAYLYFVYEVTDTKGMSFLPKSKRFNVPKFLNEVPIYSRDKQGFNVAILVIHILYMLKRRDFNSIIDRMEALQVYRNRYLKRPEDLRSKSFIKLLLVMEKQSFDYADTERKTTTYLEQLKVAKFRHEGTGMDAEIVPYETLWGMVLELLRKQS